jgi:hypothetical protein
MQEAVAQPVRAHDGDQYEDMLVAVPAELVDERHDWACDRGVLGVQYLQGIPWVPEVPLAAQVVGVPGALVRVGGRYGHGDHVRVDGQRFRDRVWIDPGVVGAT